MKKSDAPDCPGCGFPLQDEGKYWYCTSWCCGVSNLRKSDMSPVKEAVLRSNTSKSQEESSQVNEKVLEISNIIKKSRISHGYEEMLEFWDGFLYALKLFKYIDSKEYNALKKVYSNSKNGDARWFINGKGEVEVDPEGEATD